MKKFLAIALLLSVNYVSAIPFAQAKSELQQLQAEVTHVEAEIASLHRQLDKISADLEALPRSESTAEEVKHLSGKRSNLIERINTEAPKKLQDARANLNRHIQEIGKEHKVLHGVNGQYDLQAPSTSKLEPIILGETQPSTIKTK